jgi:hypothetical protein
LDYKKNNMSTDKGKREGNPKGKRAQESTERKKARISARLPPK